MTDPVVMTAPTALALVTTCPAFPVLTDFLSAAASLSIARAIAASIVDLPVDADLDRFYGRIERGLRDHPLAAIFDVRWHRSMTHEICQNIEARWDPRRALLDTTQDEERP